LFSGSVQYIDSSRSPTSNAIANHVSVSFPPSAQPHDRVAIYDVNAASNRWNEQVVGYQSNAPVELPTGDLMTTPTFLHPRWVYVEWRSEGGVWVVQSAVPFAHAEPGVQFDNVFQGTGNVQLTYGLEVNVSSEIIYGIVRTPPRPADSLLAALPTAVIGDDEGMECAISFDGFTPPGATHFEVTSSSLPTVLPTTGASGAGRYLLPSPTTATVQPVKSLLWKTARDSGGSLTLLLSHTSTV
jgi:hypothetical protein